MDSMNVFSPCQVSVKVLDPAPDASKKPPKAAASPAAAPASKSRQVVQEYHFLYKLFLPRKPSYESNYALALLVYGVTEAGHQPDYLTLNVYQHALPYNKETHAWNLRLVDTVPCLEDEEFLQSKDGSPRFHAAFISSLIAFPAALEGGGSFDWGDPDSELRVTKDTQRDRSPMFQVHGVWSEFTVLEITVVLQRQFTKRDYSYHSMSLKRKPTAKSSLLEGAQRTGDLVLVAREGVEMPAHSAVLVDFPYFEAKLREEWAGKPAWNLHNKLRLELPVPVKKEALVVFLTYVYGDTCSIYKIEPSSASLLQDILSLADACGVPALCADVIGLVLVTSSNVDSWLAWLLKQHGVDATPIRQQVVKVMKDKLQNGLRWDELSIEQLTNVAALQKSLATLVAPPENKG